MRRLIAWFVGICFLILALLLFPGTHVEQLKSRYPYGLIGDDYGVLSIGDLAVNACGVDVSPFMKDENLAYSYWQCFPTKDAEINCESLGVEPTDANETGYLEIRVHNTNGVQSYLARNAIGMKDCEERLGTWNKLIMGEKYVCLSGSFATSDNAANGTTETGWVLDKFKTLRGCESFGLDCDFKNLSDEKCSG